MEKCRKPRLEGMLRKGKVCKCPCSKPSIKIMKPKREGERGAETGGRMLGFNLVAVSCVHQSGLLPEAVVQAGKWLMH